MKGIIELVYSVFLGKLDSLLGIKDYCKINKRLYLVFINIFCFVLINGIL